MTKNRTHEKTHPWINFKLNLDQADMGIWTLAGEAKAKCEQIAILPLKPALAEHLAGVYLTKGVKGTTAIEGNSLTEEQVKKRIEGTLKLPLSQEYLGQEIDNIVSAINGIAQRVKSEGSLKLTVDLIKHFNRQVLDKLTLEPEVIPGEIRNYSVGIFNYRGAPREDCEFLLDALCVWLNDDRFSFSGSYYKRDTKIILAIIKAVIAHLYIAWIHPFGDGNGRTARLVEFLILFGSGVPDIAAHLLSNHYNITRVEYYRQLDASSKSGGNTLPFLRYALEGFIDGLEEQLRYIESHQFNVVWQNFVHESFQATKATKTNKRRRDLVLALSSSSNPVPLNQISSLNTKIALDYGNRHIRTLMRDLHAIQKMDLVEQLPNGYSAKKQKLSAFLPFINQ